MAPSPEATRMIVECPECGAALPPQAANAATTCPHCEKTSVPVARPVRVIVEHVVRAGGPVPASSAPSCPRCTGPLFEGKTKDATLLGCGVCGGIWVDNEGSQAIAQRVEPEIVALAARARGNAKASVETSAAGLPCPLCRKPLERVRAAGVADIDVCSAHGTWFDAGELERVAAVFAKIISERKVEAFEARMQRIVEANERRRQAIAAGQPAPFEPDLQDIVSFVAQVSKQQK